MPGTEFVAPPSSTCIASTMAAMEIVTGPPPFAWAESVPYAQFVAAGDLEMDAVAVRGGVRRAP